MKTLLIIMLLVGVLCLAQAIRDFRRKGYVWAALDIAAVLALVLMPIPTHAVVVDLLGATR
jgi:hypothetical protein